MVSVEEATEIILQHPHRLKTEWADLRQAIGKVLAEKVFADRDFPPFYRVAMDGIAIQFKNWEAGQKEFLIIGIQAAGEPQKKMNDPQACFEVMTGAVLPEGADTVIRYEDIEVNGNVALVLASDIRPGQNIHNQGQDAKEGTVLLEPHLILSSAEIALLASVGKSKVEVFSFPKVAVVASGDELVDVDETPALHQIRRSNSYALQASIKRMGGEATSFHLVDRKDVLRESLRSIINDHDLVILSGGVSKGKFDFIPEVLEELGIKKLFHQVSQRPGKPFWFGVGDKKTIFALPGNPVSTYMCFYKYIKPWLKKSFGIVETPSFAMLAKDFTFQPKLTYFIQVKIKNEAGKLMAYPDAGGGSGDFANLKNVDGFLELPMDRTDFKVGEVFAFVPFR